MSSFFPEEMVIYRKKICMEEGRVSMKCLLNVSLKKNANEEVLEVPFRCDVDVATILIANLR